MSEVRKENEVLREASDKAHNEKTDLQEDLLQTQNRFILNLENCFFFKSFKIKIVRTHLEMKLVLEFGVRLVLCIDF